MEIKILTDACADLPASFSEKEGITVLPVPIVTDDGTDVALSSGAFWAMLESGKRARTSQPNREEMRTHFEKAKREGYALVCVLISSRLSGTYDTAVALQKEVGYEHVYLVDSRNATMGEGLIVRKASELRKTESDPQAVYEALLAYRNRIRLYAGIDTLKYLARGGRLSFTLYAIGSLLNVKPVISIDGEGKIDVVAKKIGVKQAIRAVLALIQEDTVDRSEPVVPLYAKEDKNATALCEAFLAAYPEAELESATEIGPVVGAHIGPGGFGLVYVIKE